MHCRSFEIFLMGRCAIVVDPRLITLELECVLDRLVLSDDDDSDGKSDRSRYT